MHQTQKTGALLNHWGYFTSYADVDVMEAFRAGDRHHQAGQRHHVVFGKLEPVDIIRLQAGHDE